MAENSFDKVYNVVSRIPKGRVTSYGAIAEFLCMNARTIGWAMHSCSGKPWLPAHRVVNSKGILTAAKHFTHERMEELLNKERIIIRNGKIENFNKVFWDPKLELRKNVYKKAKNKY